jgi:hypothetical protein
LITNGDYEAFQRQASEFIRTWAPVGSDGYAVVLRDLDGQQLINTRLPWGTPLPKIARESDRFVVATKRPQVQDLFWSVSADRQLIAVRVPVFKDGETTHVLSLALEPRQIAELLRTQPLPATWNRTVFDKNERAVARWPAYERFVGTLATENLRRNAVGNEGTLVSTNFEGVPVLVAYARSELSGWRTIVSIPLSVIQAPERQWRMIVAILCTVAFVLLISLAFLFGRRIARPIRML